MPTALFHLQGGKTDVDAIDVAQKESEREERHQAP
jgi:hypothetical protein